MLNPSFAKRRQQVFAHLPIDSIVILYSGTEQRMSHDQFYRFQPDRDFYYLTGFTEPEAIAVLTTHAQQNEFILFNRPSDPEQEIWDGRRAGQEGACTLYGADKAFNIAEFEHMLPQLLMNKQQVYYTVGRYPQLDEQIIKQMLTLQRKIRAGVAYPQQFINIETLVHPMRRIKDQYEIELMRKACQISAQAHIRAMQFCAPGLYEYQIEAELTHEFRRQGCKWPAYTPIVGSGANSCILHYTDNDAELYDGDLLLIDTGGEYQGYAADITRTIPVNGKFSAAQSAVYEIVLEAQQAVIEIIKPGLAYHELQQLAVQIITKGLVKLGILQGDVDTLILNQAYKTFYMHNIGHWLGLDTHDAGNYCQNNEWIKLQPGFVLTVEPGIYIPAGTSGVAEQWWNIGIRIEDNVLVTATGYEVLSQDAPKTIAAIEQLMAG